MNLTVLTISSLNKSKNSFNLSSGIVAPAANSCPPPTPPIFLHMFDNILPKLTLCSLSARVETFISSEEYSAIPKYGFFRFDENNIPITTPMIESGNHLVVKWLNHNEVPEVLDDFKLSKYFDGSNTPEIIGKWMYFNRCSPNKPGSDHQAIFTYNTDGEIMLVEFRSNGKVNSITVTPSPSRKLTRYGKKWYTLWKPGRKMSVRLTRLRVNKGSINLSLHIPDKLESEFVLQ